MSQSDVIGASVPSSEWQQPGYAEMFYPDSDGRPMAENDQQYRTIVDTRFALEEYYRDNRMVYVGADMLVYFERGDPTKSVAPDVFVSLGVPKVTRRSYFIWAEGKAPDVVFEIASPGSWRADITWKRGLYAGLGIREYFVFDPKKEFISPVLQGFRLDGAFYGEIGAISGGRGEVGVHSEVMALELWAVVNEDREMPRVLRLFDPRSGEWLRTPAQEAESRRVAEASVRQEAEARQADGALADG